VARSLADSIGNLAPSYQSASGLGEFFGFGILMMTVVAVYEKNVPKAGSGVAVGAALVAGLLTTKGILNPAVAIAMNQTISPATWATILSGFVFAIFFKLLSDK
jgi:aquaporin Z